MSKVALSGNALGTGTFTIASPNSNTDRTLSLPDASGTVQVSGNPISGTTGTFSGLIAANGGGVQFPATQSASSDANTLDDYEEGTWSPTISGWTGTYSAQFGVYTKIGNLVYVFGRATTNGGTGTFTDPFPGINNFPIPGGPVGSAAKGMWFVTSGSTGLTSSQTASGPLDGPGNGGVATFPNWIITGGNVTNWGNSQLSAAGTVEYRFFCTYTSA